MLDARWLVDGVDVISVIELAKEMNVRKQNLFKQIERLSLHTELLRTDDSRGQLVAHLSDIDADVLRTSVVKRSTEEFAEDEPVLSGWFYLVQLEPEVDPGRYKLGFASDLDQRLRKHRTAAPFASHIASWPCKSLWEKTAIDAISIDSVQLHTEVFRTSDISKVKEKADKFFSIMPNLRE